MVTYKESQAGDTGGECSLVTHLVSPQLSHKRWGITVCDTEAWRKNALSWHVSFRRQRSEDNDPNKLRGAMPVRKFGARCLTFPTNKIIPAFPY